MIDSVFNIPSTYSGLLDDVVERHRITPEVDESFFTRSIIRNVFFSGRVFINDGYLVNHPSALLQLMNEDSVLRVMIKNDFVMVLARQSDPESFANNPELMAARGVDSFQTLVSRSDWPDIKQNLRRWSEGLFVYKKIRPWPNYKMQYGFRKLFNRIFDKTLLDLGIDEGENFSLKMFEDRYKSHPSFENGPRTAVEAVAESMHNEGHIKRSTVTSIMNIANQCYHYNFALCLGKYNKEAVIADTTIGKAFDDILEFSDVVEAELSQVPVLSIPRGFPTSRGAIFDRVLDPQSNLARAKHEFLRDIDVLFKSKKLTAAEKVRALTVSSEKYRSYLSDYFSDIVGISDLAPRRGALVTFGLGSAGSVFGADNIMLAANLAAGDRISSFVHRLSKPIRQRILDVSINPSAGETKQFTFNAGEIRPRFASLAFDSVALDNHVLDLPVM